MWHADRTGTVVAAALQALGALSGIGVVLASKLALDAVLDAPSASSVSGTLVLALAVLAAVVAISSSVGVLQSQQQRILGERVTQQMWRGVLRACAGVPLVTWESTSFLDRLERVRNNALSRPASVVSSVLGLAGGLVGLVGMVVALAALDPLLVPTLLVVAVPVVALNRLSSRLEFRFAVRTNPLQRRRLYLKVVLISRPNAAEVRAFGAAPHLLGRHGDADADYLADLVPHVRRRQGLGLLSTLVSALGLAATLVLVVVLVQHGRLSLSEAGAAAIAARLLGGQMTTTLTAMSTLNEAVPFLADLESFLDDAVTEESLRPGRPLDRALTLRDVSFAYPDHEPAVREVSISLPRGSVVALVGENGSGKTTLAKVVAGLYAPTSGSVSWDDEPAAGHDLRASVTVLFQDFIRYQMSARDNIVLADTRRPVEEEHVRAAARSAGIDEALAALPSGYDTMLGQELEAGSDLSGGQWQRVALARALYRDSAVVVLDEPTAAMDPRAEAALFGDVRSMLAGRTALLISHRFSSVRSADYIYVMDAGRVAEEGTHDELVALGGTYAELYALQAAAYLD
ncbi:ABC transporter ATP-binding protein [Nocardioides mangrovicus]|uniref:ABC transporter ATP-binding protein n=1 Tax=Nocardioides mangrovicus TaxID=2478913 RepID=A0A3L8NZY0_9ACTN|nr:ABC transporter ATP-binding protein [Nocardioides mangrovicus]